MPPLPLLFLKVVSSINLEHILVMLLGGAICTFCKGDSDARRAKPGDLRLWQDLCTDCCNLIELLF